MATKKAKDPFIFRADLLGKDKINGYLIQFGLLNSINPKNMEKFQYLLDSFHKDGLIVVFVARNIRTEKFLEKYEWIGKTTKFKDLVLKLFYEPGTLQEEMR
jgi:hypothetical protein